MATLEQIEAAISSLPPEGFRALAEWIRALDADRWDAQMDRDAASGKLNFLADEAGQLPLESWPPAE